MNNEFKSLRDSVLAKIKNERVAMHSQTYFAFKIIAFALVAALVLTISVFLCNFIFFAIQASGSDQLLGFGDRGIIIFIQIFPWWLLIIDIVLIILLEWLLRRFRFGYKSPVLYLLFVLAIITISIAFTVEHATPFNDFLRDRAHENRLPPPLNDIYERSDRPGGPDDGVCRCTVRAVQGNSISADDIDIGTTTHYTIIVPMNDGNATTTGLTIGDVILVAGEKSGNSITAFGIKKLPAGSSSVGEGDGGANGPHETDDAMHGGASNDLH